MKPARWCRHIRWHPFLEVGMPMWQIQENRYWLVVPKRWRQCPICGTFRPSAKPRPTR